MKTKVETVSQRNSRNQSRSLHLIDIENLLGRGKVTKEQVSWARKLYITHVPAAEHDLFMVAAGPHNRKEVVEGWPGAIYRFWRGADGADLALIGFYQELGKAREIKHLFIGSGDNKFSTVAHLATQSGIRTTVVLGVGKKSWKLRAESSISLLGGE